MPDTRRFLIALLPLAIGLASCGDEGASQPSPPDNPPALQRVIEDARHEMREGRLGEAASLFDEALGFDPNSAVIWTDIARLRFRGGEHRAALEAADHALSLDSGYAPALLMKAQMVRDAHGLTAATLWFEAGLQQHPDNPDLLAEYAATLGDLGRNRDMLAVVQKLTDAAKEDPKTHFLRAVLAARAGDPVLASSLLKRSGLREAGIPAAILLGALVEMEQGNPDNAANALQTLHERQPGNRRVLELFARALWLSGRDRELIDRFGELAGSREASPYLTMLAGRSLERLGQRREAAALIENARSRPYDMPLNLAAYGVGANLPEPTREVRRLIAAGQQQQAHARAANHLRRFPGSADLLTIAGDAALAAGDGQGALGMYGQAAQIRRPWPLTRKIILAYRMTGDDDAAHALLVRHLTAEPRNTEALFMLASEVAAEEDWLRAAILLDNVMALGAGNDPELLALRIEAARALGDTNVAERLAAWIDDLRPAPFLRP